MFAMGLRQVQQALDRKADQIQQEFVGLTDELDELGRKLLEAENDQQRTAVREQQQALRERQHQLAEEVNSWRERARKVRSQPGENALRGFLEDLQRLDDPILNPAIEHALYLMDAPEEELEALLSQQKADTTVTTPAGRLLQRARTEFDLRGADSGARQRAAVEFANRPGLAQKDEVLAEIEAALDDQDPMVKEVAVLTVIQLYRFRAMRSADLDEAHAAVKKLADMNHVAVIPTLIEILEKPRTGYVQGEKGTIETSNNRARMVALLRLIEWHTQDAKMAVHKIQFDRDEDLVKAAQRALELFPGDWNAPLRPTGRLPKLDLDEPPS